MKRRPLVTLHGFLFALSIGALALLAASGVALIPSKYIFYVSHYWDDSRTVLASIGNRLSTAPLFTLAAWLGPLLVAPFIPLAILGPLLAILSYVVGIIMWASLMWASERARLLRDLENVPDLGYMWHDTILIALCFVFVQTDLPYLMLLGPGAMVCGSRTVTCTRPWIFLVLALVSIVIVLPSAIRFVDDDGSMFIAGYASESLFAQMISYSMIFAFVKAYHLVSRGAYQVYFREGDGVVMRRAIVLVWVLMGTALVELWGSAGWAFYLAFASSWKICEEPGWACRLPR